MHEALGQVGKSNLAFCQIAAEASEEDLKKLFHDENLDAAQLRTLMADCSSRNAALRSMSLIQVGIAPEDLRKAKTKMRGVKLDGGKTLITKVQELEIDILLNAAVCARESRTLCGFLYGLSSEDIDRLLEINPMDLRLQLRTTPPAIRLRLDTWTIGSLVNGKDEKDYADLLGKFAKEVPVSEDLPPMEEFTKSRAFTDWIVNTNRLLLGRNSDMRQMRVMLDGLIASGLSTSLASYLSGYKSWSMAEKRGKDNGNEWKSTRTRLHVLTREKLLTAQLTLLSLLYLGIKEEREEERESVFGFDAFNAAWQWFVQARETDLQQFEKEVKSKCRLLCADDLAIPLLWIEGQEPVLNPVKALAADKYELSYRVMSRAFTKENELVRPTASVCLCPACGGRVFLSHMSIEVQACPWCGAKWEPESEDKKESQQPDLESVDLA